MNSGSPIAARLSINILSVLLVVLIVAAILVILWGISKILEKYKNNVCAYGRYAKVFSGAMGDIYYMAKFNNIEEMNEFKDFVGERN